MTQEQIMAEELSLCQEEEDFIFGAYWSVFPDWPKRGLLVQE